MAKTTGFSCRRDAARPTRVRAKHFVRLVRPDHGTQPRTQAAKCGARGLRQRTAALARRRRFPRRNGLSAEPNAGIT